MMQEIDSLRVIAENIIKETDHSNILFSRVEENFIKAMISKESKLRGNFHNWMLKFNWKTGRFEGWELTSRNPNEASKKYSETEKYNPSESGYEVVMIGASDVSTIIHTHSHYFGIASFDRILEDIDESILAFSKRNVIDQTSRTILYALVKRDFWGIKKVNITTIKNHYCKDIDDIEEKIKELSQAGFVIADKKGNVSLNQKKKAYIEDCL